MDETIGALFSLIVLVAAATLVLGLATAAVTLGAEAMWTRIKRGAHSVWATAGRRRGEPRE
jgi:hypothetical protein